MIRDSVEFFHYRENGPAHFPTITANMGDLHKTLAYKPAEVKPIKEDRQLADRDQE